MAQLYSKKYLINALKEAGLPSSIPTILKYEREGIIPAPKTSTVGRASVIAGGREWRFYTQDEITKIVERVRRHLNK